MHSSSLPFRCAEVKKNEKTEDRMPQVFNLRHKKCPDDSVRVDRSTPYGNPFIIGKDGDREQVCLMFSIWIRHPDQTALREKGKLELKGKDLCCWCAPERCHASTWIEIANGE